MEDTSCSVFMGSIKAFQVIENEVVAIVGPQSSGIARIISHVANGLQVPVISYAASDPMLSSIQFPYFFRMAPTDSNQMAAIADIIEVGGWKEIIAIFSDDDYGRNGVNALGRGLPKKISIIYYKLPLSPEYDQTEVYDVLNKSKTFGPRVYVVHISPDPRLKFFRIAKKLGMNSSNYVWFATDWLSSTLDSIPKDRDSLKILQGLVTLHPRISNTPKKKAFVSRWRNNEDLKSWNFTAYGLYAYDAMWLFARSIDRFLEKNGGITFSSSDNRNLKVFDGGENLLKLISNSNFTGLTGQVQFDADRNLMRVDYEIINVVRETTYKVGYWLNDSVLSVQKLNNITWPGGEVEKPRGWVIATVDKPLRIAFPKRVSSTEFVTGHNHSHRVQDYCIDLFNEVLKLIPYDVPFRFEPFGNGLNNPNYGELVRMVADDGNHTYSCLLRWLMLKSFPEGIVHCLRIYSQVFDAAVGDIAIVTDRIKIVDFTLPFAATGLMIVAPTVNLTSSGWVFMKPFTPELWYATAASFVIIAVVIWMLEHRVNDDFRGPPRRQLRTMFLFSFSTLFKANYENTVSTLGRTVMVVWQFLLLVITSSYTASLSSILTVEHLSTCITGLDSLISSGLPIGYQVGSFAYSYMINSLNIHPSRLVSLGSPEEYECALRRGVAAIVDEILYVELFLSKQTDFGIVGQPFTKSGWGFAFQKDSPLATDMSTAILKLAESGELQKIHEKWFCKTTVNCPGEERRKSEANQLHLSSFWGLCPVCGLFALMSLFLFLIRAVRQYIRYRRTHTDRSSPVFSISSITVLFSQSVHNFLEFVDEKEEAIKRIFAQHENPPARVN